MNRIGIFIFTVFVCSCSQSVKVNDFLGLQKNLSGTWHAVAFDGALHETWMLNQDGWMEQQGFYIEGADTSYSAITRIEQVGDDVILFSVIKDSNPKIFKAKTQRDGLLVFENKDYKNPYEVKYEFISNEKYRRTITGYEQDSLVTYVFNFEKVNP